MPAHDREVLRSQLFHPVPPRTGIHHARRGVDVRHQRCRRADRVPDDGGESDVGTAQGRSALALRFALEPEPFRRII